MKLVELLAIELQEWPENGCVAIAQDSDKSCFFWDNQNMAFSLGEWLGNGLVVSKNEWQVTPFLADLATDYDEFIVTREMWEAERAHIAQAHAFQWRDRIRELDFEVEALEEERLEMMNNIKDAGISLPEYY